MSNHLTDEQILVLDDINHIHLTSCELCQQRLQNRDQIRKQLAALPLLPAPEIIAHKIETELNARQTSTSLNTASNNRGFMWRTSLVSMAASIVVVVAISWWRVTAPVNDDVYSALVQIIEKNNQVFKQNSHDIGTTEVFMTMQFDDELSDIETAIQRAYLNNSSPEKKLKLWERRHALLKKMKQSQLTATQQQI
ncbi:MAG: hypothetical protein ABJK37_11155 [Paraglaciecola sp.]|uniref:hypothetical protein n=1 Tax=Paraglaciecola sp. TaxID=1920173 RepID=UPI003299E36E